MDINIVQANIRTLGKICSRLLLAMILVIAVLSIVACYVGFELDMNDLQNYGDVLLNKDEQLCDEMCTAQFLNLLRRIEILHIASPFLVLFVVSSCYCLYMVRSRHSPLVVLQFNIIQRLGVIVTFTIVTLLASTGTSFLVLSEYTWPIISTYYIALQRTCCNNMNFYKFRFYGILCISLGVLFGGVVLYIFSKKIAERRRRIDPSHASRETHENDDAAIGYTSEAFQDDEVEPPDDLPTYEEAMLSSRNISDIAEQEEVNRRDNITLPAFLNISGRNSGAPQPNPPSYDEVMENIPLTQLSPHHSRTSPPTSAIVNLPSNSVEQTLQNRLSVISTNQVDLNNIAFQEYNDRESVTSEEYVNGNCTPLQLNDAQSDGISLDSHSNFVEVIENHAIRAALYNVDRNDILSEEHNNREILISEEHLDMDDIPSEEDMNRANLISEEHLDRDDIPSEEHMNREMLISEEHLDRDDIPSEEHMDREMLISEEHLDRDDIPSEENMNREMLISHEHHGRDDIPNEENMNRDIFISEEHRHGNDIPSEEHMNREISISEEHHNRDDILSREILISEEHLDMDDIPHEEHMKGDILISEEHHDRDDILSEDMNNGILISEDNLERNVNDMNRESNTNEEQVNRDEDLQNIVIS